MDEYGTWPIRDVIVAAINDICNRVVHVEYVVRLQTWPKVHHVVVSLPESLPV